MYVSNRYVIFILSNVLYTWGYVVQQPDQPEGSDTQSWYPLDKNVLKNSQAMVVEVHHESQDRLMREETSTIKIQTGITHMPEVEDKLKNLFTSNTPSPDSKKESNDLNRNPNEGYIMSITEAPFAFKTQRKRWRTTTQPKLGQSPSDQEIQIKDAGLVELTITKLPQVLDEKTLTTTDHGIIIKDAGLVEMTITKLPQVLDEKTLTTTDDGIIIDIDKMIALPVISCPKGQNEDLAKRCRPVFHDNY